CESSAEFSQRFAAETIDVPSAHALGAEAFVEIDGGLVPVEHRPFDFVAARFHGLLGKMGDERFAITASTEFGTNEQVFKKNAAAGGEAVVGEIPRRDSGGRVGFVEQSDFQRGVFADEIARDDL